MRRARVQTTRARTLRKVRSKHASMRNGRAPLLRLPRYLYNNAIKHGLQGLCALKTLRALYLNDNCVADISGLCNLPQLQKLYLQVRLPCM